MSPHASTGLGPGHCLCQFRTSPSPPMSGPPAHAISLPDIAHVRDPLTLSPYRTAHQAASAEADSGTSA
eukprot:2155112-Rhodomonas_salina.2